ncbi:MAG TPA: hypothetical protein VIV63_14315 [Steroidobacteraceae bacterium]
MSVTSEELPRAVRIDGIVRTTAQSRTAKTDSQAFWVAIRNRTDAIGFQRYSEFIHELMCGEGQGGAPRCGTTDVSTNDSAPGHGSYGAPSLGERRDELRTRPSIYGMDAYQVLLLATQAFVVFEAGVVIASARLSGGGVVPGFDGPGDALESRIDRTVTLAEIRAELEDYLSASAGRGLPYLSRIVGTLVAPNSDGETEQVPPWCRGILRNRFSCPSMLELIWSYWHEEGMLVQSLNALSLRFQNRRIGDRDPLAQLEIDALRPLNNLLWGYIQDEQNRLTLVRRAYEYDHHYGIKLVGKAVPTLRSADSRSKFIESFHNLLYRSAKFYQEDADTNVVADGFPLLNALKEVHLILAEGAHNQFGDLPWTARVEMLIQQWLLARPEIREFIRGRVMVPYREDWMGQVDAMKKLQGWTDVSITHFHDLGRYGEQLLLSVRYDDWSNVADQEIAKAWVRYWKPEVQGYLHAYRSATGQDLTVEPVDSNSPSVHLRTRLEDQRRRGPGG